MQDVVRDAGENMSRESRRDRVRHILAEAFAPGTKPWAEQESLADDIVKAVLAREENEITVYGVLITRLGRVLGLGLFNEAHPTLEGRETHPLFTAHARYDLIPPSAHRADRWIEKTNALRHDHAIRDVGRAACERVKDPQYAWCGPIRGENQFGFYRETGSLGAELFHGAVPRVWRSL